MILTAVHIDPDTGKVVRWQVENSWGPDACNKVNSVSQTDAELS